MLTLLLTRSGSVALLWLCMFLASFSIGLGPGTFVVASEIVPLSARSKTMGVVICVNRLGVYKYKLVVYLKMGKDNPHLIIINPRNNLQFILLASGIIAISFVSMVRCNPRYLAVCCSYLTLVLFVALWNNCRILP